MDSEDPHQILGRRRSQGTAEDLPNIQRSGEIKNRISDPIVVYYVPKQNRSKFAQSRKGVITDSRFQKKSKSRGCTVYMVAQYIRFACRGKSRSNIRSSRETCGARRSKERLWWTRSARLRADCDLGMKITHCGFG